MAFSALNQRLRAVGVPFRDVARLWLYQGGITEIEGFLLRLPNGETIRLRPADGVLFHDDSPIGHIRDHLRSGEPVEVEYEILDDGSAVAYKVTD